MKITCEGKQLNAAFELCSSVLRKRAVMEICTASLVETSEDRLNISATNLDTWIKCAIPCNVGEPGSTVLPIAFTNKIASYVGDNAVTIEGDGEKADFRSGKSEFKTPCYKTEDFPVEFVVEGTPLKLSAGLLSEILNGTVFCAERNSSGTTVRNGVHFSLAENILTASSMNMEHKCAIFDAEMGDLTGVGEFEVVIPVDSILSVQQVLSNRVPEENVSLSTNVSLVKFDFGDVVIISRTLDGKMPDLKRIIPKTVLHDVTLDRKACLRAAKVIKELTNDGIEQSCRVALHDGEFVLSGRESKGKTANEYIPVEFTGEPWAISMTTDYLIGAFSATNDDKIRMCIGEGSKNLTFKRPDREDWLHLVAGYKDRD